MQRQPEGRLRAPREGWRVAAGAGWLAGLVATVIGAGSAQAQSLAERVAAVGTGTVRLEYASRQGVCGNGRGNISLRHGDGRTTWSGGTTTNSRRAEWEDECEPGPVRLAVDVERRRVTEVRAYVGGRWRGEADRDLGTVPPTEAQAWLLGLAEQASDRAAGEVIFPAMIADAPDPWRRLLALAKDEGRPRGLRNSATFWLSQSVADEATRGLTQLIEDEGDREVRKSAVFALSQRPKDESVPALIKTARAHRDPEIRKTAIFWLGQSRDPRAIAYFEEVLLGR